MADIPESPAVELAQAKLFGSSSSLVRLQAAVDHLTRKARTGQTFLEHEKEFLRELFEAFGLGGRVSGYAEASALVRHYIDGNGETLRVDEEVYSSSVIVRDVMTVMKRQFQASLHRVPAGSAVAITSGSESLLRRTDFRELMSKSRDANKRGRVLPGGMVIFRARQSTPAEGQQQIQADGRYTESWQPVFNNLAGG